MKLYYLWYFKPGEKNKIHPLVLDHNAKFAKTHEIVGPDEILALLHRHNPAVVDVYTRLPKWVVKSDFARLALIYYKGGVYSDADCLIRKLPAPPPNAKVILFTEKICKSLDELGPKELKAPDSVVRVANYFFIGAKGHPFFKDCLEECVRRASMISALITEQDILWVCGPDVITTMYHKLKHKYPDVYLHDTSYLHHMHEGGWTSTPKNLNHQSIIHEIKLGKI